MLGCTAILVSAPGGLLVPLLRDSGPAGLIARRLTPVPLVFPVMTMLLRATLRRLGVPESPAAGSIYTAVDVLAAFAILWFSGLKVLAVDTMRRQAEDELRRSRDDLDVRVQLRTSELTEANRQLAVEVINRQRAQAEVQQTNAMLNSLIEACPLAICAFNLDGSLRKSNAAADALELAVRPECREMAARAALGEPISSAEISLESQESVLHRMGVADPYRGCHAGRGCRDGGGCLGAARFGITDAAGAAAGEPGRAGRRHRARFQQSADRSHRQRKPLAGPLSR
jgi:hypothetical protein